MSPPKQANCENSDPTAPLVSRCGRILIGMESSGGIIKGSNARMAELARILAIMMGRPVVDKTGFTGFFDVEMQFVPDPATAGLPGRPGSSDPTPSAPNPEVPNIFIALQEKLGLKLESSKSPVELLVIDHVDRPTEN